MWNKTPAYTRSIIPNSHPCTYLGHGDGGGHVHLREVDEAGHASRPGPVRARQAVDLGCRSQCSKVSTADTEEGSISPYS